MAHPVREDQKEMNWICCKWPVREEVMESHVLSQNKGNTFYDSKRELAASVSGELLINQ